MGIEKELANLVLSWEKVDDEVAKEGWGGDRDERWDNLKSAMVSAAHDVLSTQAICASRNLIIAVSVIGSDDVRVIGVSISVRPASEKKEGFMSMKLVAAEGADSSSCLFLPVCLDFHDMCLMLSVLCGIDEDARFVKDSPLASVTQVLSIDHNVEARAYVLNLSAFAGGKSEGVSVLMSSRDALGLRHVIEHAMLLVGCGRP